MYREVEEDSRPEKHYEPIQHDDIIFTQQKDTNSIQMTFEKPFSNQVRQFLVSYFFYQLTFSQ